MSEAQTWHYLRPRLETELHAERITERHGEGIGDVIYLHRRTRQVGWVELKFLTDLPGPRTQRGLLDVADLKKEQTGWLNNWARQNGTAGVLLRIGTHRWYYWRATGLHQWANDILKWSTDEAIGRAQGLWEDGLETKSLIECLLSNDGYPYETHRHGPLPRRLSHE